MVFVELDSSAILVEPLKNKSTEEMTQAYQLLLDEVKKAGARPTKHVMDNEASEARREVIEKECQLELVPPGCHRQNVAEVAIKYFKQHFIAILVGLPCLFPIRLWCELLLQAKLTLNIVLRTRGQMYRLTPTSSSLSILIAHHSHQLDVQCSAMKNQATEEHGRNIQSTAGS